MASTFHPSPKAYGTWDSPINADFITRQVIGIEDVLVDSFTGTIYHVEKRPSEKGRNALVQTRTNEELLPMPWDAKTGVHTYGGSAVSFANGSFLFSNAGDSRLYTSNGKVPTPSSPDYRAWRYADFSPHPKYPHLFVAIREDHTRPEPVNVITTLVCVNIRDATVKIVANGADFYSNACFSPDGKHVAWIQWHHPEMPWQSAELAVADVELEDDSFTFKDSVVVAGEHGKVVAQQPTWVSNERLIFICDKSGWLNPWTYSLSKSAKPVLPHPVEEEFGEPMWFLGGSSYAILDSDRSVWTTVKNGVSAIYLLHLDSAQLTPISADFVEIRRVRHVDSQSVVFIAKTGIQPDFLVNLSFDDDFKATFETLKETFLPGDSVSADYFSIGRSLRLEGPQEEPIHAVFYPPQNPNYLGLPSELPPCVVFIHGGPSARQGVGFDWYHQYYTSRGWAWLDVNYGGSTGYGRKYMQRIYGLWGEIDINDSMHAVKEIQRLGFISQGRVIVRGNSAGGFSVLRSLVTFPTFYQAGISSYGISDLQRLAETTHKLHYMFKLQGGTPQEIPEVYRARSPIYHADKIESPLLVFQGDADVAVPAAQSEKIVETIRARGGRADYILFPGEGHGWRKASTIKTALEKELSFAGDLVRILGPNLKYSPYGDLMVVTGERHVVRGEMWLRCGWIILNGSFMAWMNEILGDPLWETQKP